jgi:hypothetical protein
LSWAVLIQRAISIGEQVWREARIDFDLSVERSVAGVRVPVMPLEQLIDYKRRLDREVDRLDIAELVAANLGNAG